MKQQPIDFQQYVTNALRTESTPAALTVNKAILLAALSAAVHMGNILDKLKKQAFYGKELEGTAMSADLTSLLTHLHVLQTGDITAVESVTVDNLRAVHGLLGSVTEGSEVAEALVKYLQTSSLDDINVGEEVGDDMWYKAITCDALGLDMNEILAKNIEKLRIRYPEKFDEVKAEKRDTKAERKALEK